MHACERHAPSASVRCSLGRVGGRGCGRGRGRGRGHVVGPSPGPVPAPVLILFPVQVIS